MGFADGSVRVITAEEFKSCMGMQADNMKYAILLEPNPPPGESSGAGVISAPAGNNPGPPLPRTPPSP